MYFILIISLVSYFLQFGGAISKEIKHDHSYIMSVVLNRPLIRLIIREKGTDLTQSYDKSPYTHRKIKKATRQRRKRHQNSD